MTFSYSPETLIYPMPGRIWAWVLMKDCDQSHDRCDANAFISVRSPGTMEEMRLTILPEKKFLGSASSARLTCSNVVYKGLEAAAR